MKTRLILGLAILAMIVSAVWITFGCSTTPPADLRCCKKTKIIDGKPVITYHSYPTCPTLPDWQDVGPSPPCPPESGCN